MDNAQGGVVQRFDFRVFVLGSSSTMTWKFDPTATAAALAFSVAQAARWVFRRLGLEGEEPPGLTIMVNHNSEKSDYNPWANTIRLESGDHNSKWTIAYTGGHGENGGDDSDAAGGVSPTDGSAESGCVRTTSQGRAPGMEPRVR